MGILDSNFWWSAAPEDDVLMPNSLRFRTNSYLTSFPVWNTAARQDNVWTFSCWYKGAPSGVLAQWAAPGGSGLMPTGTNSSFIYGSASNGPAAFMPNHYRFFSSGGTNSTWYDSASPVRTRDTTAWTHMVWQRTNTGGSNAPNFRFWMNGLEFPITRTSPNTTWNSGEGGVVMGGFIGAGGTYADAGGEMYVADSQFIDGTLEPPESFGRFNTQGVWVPIETNIASYGTNGWHLDFKQANIVNTNVGGLNLTGNYIVDTFANSGALDLNTTSKNFLGSGPASAMYDGAQNNGAIAGTPGDGTIVWRPDASRPINGVTLVQIRWPVSYCSLNQGQAMGPVYLNGNPVNWSASCGWITIYNDPANPISITSLGFTGIPASTARIDAIRLNGNELVEGTAVPATPNWVVRDQSGNNHDFSSSGHFFSDPTSVNYDLMEDSPTQNFATLNPLRPAFVTAGVGGSGMAVDANLTDLVTSGAGSTGAYVQGSTMILPANNTAQYYFEATVAAGSFTPGQGTSYGVSFISASLYNSGQLPSNYFPGTGGVPGQSGYDNGTTVSNGTIVTGAFTGMTAFNQTFQVWVDGRNIKINTNGNMTAGQSTQMVIPADQETVICITGYQNHTVAVNFGQQPWRFGPPVGTNPVKWQTDNLPVAPVINGESGFQIITNPSTQTLFSAGMRYLTTLNNPNVNLGFTGWLGPSYDQGLIPAGRAGSCVNMYNGNLTGSFTTEATFRGDAYWLGFLFNTPFTNVTSIRIFYLRDGTGYYGGGDQIYVNAVKQPTASNAQYSGTTYVYTLQPGSLPSTVSQLTIGRGANNFAPIIYGIEINNLLLTDQNTLLNAQAVFPSGMWWIKSTSAVGQHKFCDSLRAAGNYMLQSPAFAAETGYVEGAGNKIGFLWNAPTTFDPLPNSSGMTAAAGRVNTNTGFSIVTYTPGPYSSGNMRVGTGLQQPADCVFIKNRNLPSNGANQTFMVWHRYSIGVDPFNAGSVAWFDTTPGSLALNSNSARFSYNSDAQTIGNGENYVMYCWHSVPGYSKFGLYTGNGSADGPFIDLGFKPALVIYKSLTTGNWVTRDSNSDPSNPANTILVPNLDQAQATANSEVDLVANGFKIRATQAGTNAASQPFIYMAWAENPFGGSNVAPVTSR